MALNIKISNFEGPFDLLLHLIKKNEMSIYDIRIYDITTQYLGYLDNMKEMDLEITSEFVLVAATLLEIKSRMLLPKEKNKEEDENEEDPRKLLIDRLIEYKKFKQAADYLRVKKNEAGIMYTKKPEIIEDRNSKVKYEDILKDVTMLDLYNLYIDLINRFRSKLNTENIIQTRIPVDKFKIEDKMEEIRSRIDTHGRVVFTDIMYDCTAKIEIVVTFLAMLELIKLKVIKVLQEDNFQEIYIEKGVTDEI